MAITKILNINAAKSGNPAAHLEYAINYIQNPDKTNEKVLVGSINCLPDTAFSQMMDTKQMFEKSGKRQGYHIVISFPKGEATPEQVMEVTKRFAEEHLGEYEVVYAVHTDKEHCHGHIVWNSVSLITGHKYNSPKGNWKRVLQPLTNKLCKELGLSVMPAEYAKNPKNLSRKEWELEQKLKEMILEDALFCMRHAGSEGHFKFLMRRLGYEFEPGKYMSVKVPGRKWYHSLPELDDRFDERSFKYYLDTGAGRPKFYVENPEYIKRKNLSPYQRRFYAKIYRLRMVEQKRFQFGSAYYAKELQRFHQLQEEYLFIVKNGIKTIEDLLWYKVTKEMRQENIQTRQKELYRQNSVKKRACNTVEDIRQYQIWHMDVQSELDSLKQEKRENKKNLKLVDECLKEKLYTASVDIADMEERISNTVEFPEYSYGKDERVWDDSGKDAAVDEAYISDTAEIAANMVVSGNSEPKESSALSVAKSDINEAVEDMHEDIYRELVSDAVMAEPVADVSGMETEPMIVVMEETVADKTAAGNAIMENAVTDSNIAQDKLTYEAYCQMTSEEKAKAAGFTGMRSFDTVVNVVQAMFYEMGHKAGIDEIMAEAKVLYEGMEKYVTGLRVDEILKDMAKMEVSYSRLTDKEKAEVFDFRVENSNYNLKLYLAVMKAVGIRQSMDEMYEDYQGIYDKTVEMQMEKETDRKNEERGRGR